MRRRERVLLILQARMGSRRLPGKSLLPLAGAPLVGRIIERVRRCQSIDEIVLATTRKSEDDPLEALAHEYEVTAFRGAEDDVLDRYYQAARQCDGQLIVRLPADNPVPEPEEIDRIVAYHRTGQSEFSSNLAQVYGNGYPDGIGAEVMSFDVLQAVWHACTESEKREHPHLNFFDYRAQQATDPDCYRVGTVQCPAAFRRPDLVLDVNTPEEYAVMAALYEALYPRNHQFHITDIIRWHDALRSPVTR